MREVPLLARGLLGEWVGKAAQLLVDDLPAIHTVANQVARVLLAHTEQLGATSPLVPPVARVWLRADLADRYAGALSHWGDDIGRAAATQVGRRLGRPTPSLRVEVHPDTTLRRLAYQVSSLPSWAVAAAPSAEDDRITAVPPAALPASSTRPVPAAAPGNLVVTRLRRRERLEVQPGDSVELGRTPGPLALDDEPTVSAQHCRITWEGGQPLVTHLSRTNPTLVNGAPVSRAVLADGDTLEIGNVRLAVAWGMPVADGPGTVPLRTRPLGGGS